MRRGRRPAAYRATARRRLIQPRQSAKCSAKALFQRRFTHAINTLPISTVEDQLEKGALGRLIWLLERHPRLQATLFVTPDWRQISPIANRFWRRAPWLRDRAYLAKVRSKGTMDLRRHPEFVAFLNATPRTQIALHGLHHIHPGRSVSVEFQRQDRAACAGMLGESIRIFDEAGLRWTRGLQPPGWNCPPALLQACGDVGIEWVTSARDICTPVSKQARTAMSGLCGVSMIFPERLAPNLVHVSTNFQATSPAERAFEILDAGGVLSIKAHITKYVPGARASRRSRSSLHELP